MLFDEIERITKAVYREELLKEIESIDQARDYICQHFSKPLECHVEYCKLGKMRIGYIEKLYNLDRS